MYSKNYEKIYNKCSQMVDADKWGKYFFNSVFNDVYIFMNYIKYIESEYYDNIGEAVYSRDVWFEKYSGLHEFEKDGDIAKYYENIFNILYDEMMKSVIE